MATDAASLLVRIEATAAQLRSEMARAERTVGQTASRIEREASRADRAIAAIGSRLKVALAGVAVGTVVKNILQTITQFEKLDVRIARLTGSQSEFSEAQRYLSETAQRLNVDLATLTGSYAGLLSLQQDGKVSHEQARQLLEGLTDASAALGAETSQLGQVFFGLQQALGSASVTMEDVRQVTDPLPGLFEKIARAAGKTSGEFKQMISDGKVTSRTFAEYLVRALEAYAGASEDMAATVSGSWTRLGNAWTELKRTLEDPISDVLTPLIDTATRTINRLRALLDDDIGAEIQSLRDQIATAEATPQPLRGFMLGAQAQFGGYGSIAEMRAALVNLEKIKKFREELGDVRAPVAGEPPVSPALPTKPSAAPPGGTGDKDFDKIIRNLEAERAALSMTSRERFIDVQVRKLDATATAEQKGRVRELAAAYYDEQRAKEALKVATELAVETATKEEDQRAAAVQRGKELIKAQRDQVKALEDRRIQAEEMLRISMMTTRQQRVELIVLEQINAAREAGLPLGEKEIEQRRRLAAEIVNFEMAAESNAESMEYLGQIGERAFDRIGEGITQMALEGKDAFGSLRNIGLAVVSELAQEFLKLAAINPLKNALFDTGEQTLQTIGGGLLSGLFGGAGTGSVGNYNRVSTPGGMGGMATGGLVRGPGSGTSDSIPMMLSNGEYVINASAAAKHRPLLDAINAGRPTIPSIVVPRSPEPMRGGVSHTYAPTIQVDARNSTLTEGQIRGIVQSAVAQSVSTVRQIQWSRGDSRI